MIPSLRQRTVIRIQLQRSQGPRMRTSANRLAPAEPDSVSRTPNTNYRSNVWKRGRQSVALIQAIAQITVNAPYFEKSICAVNASRGRCARRAVTNAIAVVLPACSAAIRVRPRTTRKTRATQQLRSASMEYAATFANSELPRCPAESFRWLRPTRRQELRGGLRADDSKSG